MRDQYDPAPARLVVVGPAHLRGQELILSGDDVIVGRGARCHLVLPDPYVSRAHAVIRTTGERAVVEDLGSGGGTTVNGAPAVVATALHDGDVISFAGVSVRYADRRSLLDETRIGLPPPEPSAAPVPYRPAARSAAAPAAVRYDIGQQNAGVISNVGRDQYNAYVQQRESFLREIAGTKSKARALAWLGFLLLVPGFVVYGATVLRFIQRVPTLGEDTDPQDIQLLGPRVGGVPVGVIGLGLFLLGSILLIVGIVLHVVAAARRRRVERDLPSVALRPS